MRMQRILSTLAKRKMLYKLLLQVSEVDSLGVRLALIIPPWVMLNLFQYPRRV
jgi:hypothetical protein